MGRRTSLAAAMLLVLMEAAPARASHVTGRCDTGIPADEQIGFDWFPRGDVFCSLIADPKSDGSFASYVHGSSNSALGTDLAALGVGDRVDLFRVNGPRVGEGLQLGVAGNVYAQFDLDTPSYDLINADYLLGLPLTMRLGSVSGRVRLYHQSSHLGDEYLLRPGVVAQRENFSFESLEALGSVELGAVRVYGGAEYVFDRTPGSRVSRLVHGGVELREGGALAQRGTLGNVRLVGGVDLKAAEELDWDVGVSARAGLEFGPGTDPSHRTRRLSLLGEYYNGPSPYGQFFLDQVAYYGVGIHLGP
jgi:hypothetical protein